MYIVVLYSDLSIEGMASGPEQKDHAQLKVNIEASILNYSDLKNVGQVEGG